MGSYNYLHIFKFKLKGNGTGVNTLISKSREPQKNVLWFNSIYMHKSVYLLLINFEQKNTEQ